MNEFYKDIEELNRLLSKYTVRDSDNYEYKISHIEYDSDTDTLFANFEDIGGLE